MDERQELNAGRAALMALTVIMLGALGVLAWEYVTTKDVRNTGAILILLGSGLLFFIFQRLFGAEAPRTLFGVELPTSSDPVSVASRRRAYAVDALVTAAGMTAVEAVATLSLDRAAQPSWLASLLTGPMLAVSLVASFVVLAMLSYALTFVLGEQASAAVERRLARLEAE